MWLGRVQQVPCTRPGPYLVVQNRLLVDVSESAVGMSSVCRRQGPRSQAVAGGPGDSFLPHLPQDSAGTCVSVSWLEKALSKRKVLYLGGGVPGTWASRACGKRRAEVKVGRSSSMSRTGLSRP